ncbi:hypothetical protein LWI28_008008 [Acer negundo]|uniref:Uncharacterized protein n=1 Tax=Acer negundo TaxID=4023 RepID=A0AAD5JCS1_ACENE|nr:hypothetical protein LWI28_008008 [Acer negundo]
MYGWQAKISSPPPPTHPTPTPHFHHHHHHHHRSHQYEYYDQHQSYYVYCGPQVVTVIREPVIDSYQAAQLYGGTVTIEYAHVLAEEANNTILAGMDAQLGKLLKKENLLEAISL